MKTTEAVGMATENRKATIVNRGTIGDLPPKRRPIKNSEEQGERD